MKANSLIASRFLSALAFQILGFYGIYQSYLETRSALLVGSVGIAFYLPTLLFTFAMGSWVDGIEKVGRAYLCAQVLQIIPALVFLYTGSNYYLIMLGLLGLATIRSLRSPLYSSLLKTQKLKNSTIAKLNTLSWQVPMVLAPLFVSLFESAEKGQGVAVMALSFQVCAVFVSFKYRRVLKKPHSFKGESFLSRIKSLSIGARPHLFGPLIVDGVLASFMALGTVLPFLLVSRGIEPVNVGLFKSLFHFSTMAAPLFCSLNLIERLNVKSFGKLVLLWSLGPLVIALTSSSFVIPVALVYMGLIDGFSSVLREKFVFAFSGQEELGRVSSFNSLTISTGDEFGEFNSGFFIQALGVDSMLVIGAGVSFLSGFFLLFVLKRKFNGAYL